ncbi:DUF6000 family protein [Gimesia sp.]|uniref:DUF6000 family protein n=1 Tax=Gimesia sp. TaxID=2024833 RepID=UPI003A93D9CD
MDQLEIQRWVSPFYLAILHGNYVSDILTVDERNQFNQRVSEVLPEMTPQIASSLISGHWREAITGSWFAGVKKYTECQSQITKRLLASETCYAGQSHVFALACFANDASVSALKQYLDRYLRQLDCYYDQNWAMPALMWIDEMNGTDHASEYLKANGLWERFIKEKNSEAWCIQTCQKHFWNLMNYCKSQFQ